MSSYYDYGSNHVVYNYELQVGGWGDYYDTLIEFNLSGSPPVAGSAELYLYAFPRDDSSTPVSMYLDRVTSSWNQSTAWPLPSSANPRTLPAPTPNSWYIIDVTDIYNGWQSGAYPNYGIELQPTNNNDEFNVFYSSDYLDDPTLRPKLVIIALPTCIGDCDNSGTVTVDELVKGVDIALGDALLSTCPAFNCNGTGKVTVDCLVKAVNAALNGCGG